MEKVENKRREDSNIEEPLSFPERAESPRTFLRKSNYLDVRDARMYAALNLRAFSREVRRRVITTYNNRARNRYDGYRQRL